MSTPRGGARARHRLGDRPHASARVAPNALLAVGFAEAVMKQHIGCACRIGAGVGSDDAVEAEERLDRLALEPLLEKIAGRAGEDRDQIPLAFNAERAQAHRDPRRAGELAESRDEPASGRDIGRRLVRERAQDVGQAREPRLVGVETLGVGRREFRHLGLGVSRRRLQIAPVGQGEEVGERAIDDPEAKAPKIEVADDGRVEQRDRIGGDRIAETRMKFLGRRRAADDRAALQHEDLQPGRGEIGCGDQGIMAASDHRDVRHGFRPRKVRVSPPRKRGSRDHAQTLDREAAWLRHMTRLDLAFHGSKSAAWITVTCPQTLTCPSFP